MLHKVTRFSLVVTGLALMQLTAAQAADSPKDALLKSAGTEIVAKVGEATITRSDLDKALKAMAARQQGGELPPEALKQAEAGVLDQLIAAEILYQEGKKAEIKDLDKQVDFRIAQGKGKFQTVAEYEAALKSSGLTENELTALIRKDTVISHFVEKTIVSTVAVTDAEVKTYYDANPAQFKKEAQIKASHILIGVDAGASDADKKTAKGKAEALLKELKAGKDFAAVAKSDSTCPSKEQGGDLGFFGRGQMVKAFEDAAFALKKDEMSDVVETQFGYHIIKLTERKEAETVPLDEVKEKLAEFLKNQKIQQKVAAFVNEQRTKLKVEKLLK